MMCLVIKATAINIIDGKIISKAIARTSFDYVVIRGSVCHESINGTRADTHTQT